MPAAATRKPIEASTPADGEWPMAELGSGQCRFACTPDTVPAADHRFCGRPTSIGVGNLHGSWCEHHLPRVWGRGTKGERMAMERPRGV